MTTLRQVRARSEGVPADRIAFRFLPMTEVDEEEEKGSKLYRVEKGGRASTQERLLAKGGPGSAVITGLHLQCARWDEERHLLAEAKPRCNVDRLPPVMLWPQTMTTAEEERRRELTASSSSEVEAASEDEEEQMYFECPVYRNEERRGVSTASGHSTNFVFNMRLPTEAGEIVGKMEALVDRKRKKKGAEYWIRRGVAAIVQLTDI